MIIKKDSKIVKVKVERKSIALKAKKESEMTKTVKVIENDLDAATRIILLENVQNHRKTITKELLSEVLGVIAGKKMMRRSKTKRVSQLKHQVRYVPNPLTLVMKTRQ
ncbi:hypothetical protein Tco_0383962 [Tanacetum coccineum]